MDIEDMEAMLREKISRSTYHRLRYEVDELSRYFSYELRARYAIFKLVRRRFGCRATDLRRRDLGAALDLLKDIGKRVSKYREVHDDFESRALKQIFGSAGEVALEATADSALKKLDDAYGLPDELPEQPPIEYGGNVLKFPDR